MLLDTPIEEYEGIYVKREDLCTPPGAPPFSKVRGLVEHLKKVKQQGFTGAAYVETSISMAGWGIAWACHELGLRCLIFNPVYKDPPPLLLYHRQQWLHWGAELEDIPAGRAKVNYYIARKRLPKHFKLLPLGIPLAETVSVTSAVARLCLEPYNTVVICIGSGTIAAGVFAATQPYQTMHGIMCRTGSINLKRNRVLGNSVFPSIARGKLEVIDMGWEYAQSCETPVPFPCHPYYDAKAFDWLINNKDKLKTPILFWNIGSTGDFGKE